MPTKTETERGSPAIAIGTSLAVTLALRGLAGATAAVYHVARTMEHAPQNYANRRQAGRGCPRPEILAPVAPSR